MYAENAELSLDDCIKTALQNNNKIKISNKNIIISKNAGKQIWNNFEPRLDVEGAVNYRYKELTASFGDQEFVLGEKEVETMRASLMVPVYDFGSASELNKSFDLQYENSKLKLERTQKEIIYGVTIAYFRLLEAQKFEILALNSLKLTETFLNTMIALFKEGLITSYKVEDFKLSLTQKNEALNLARNNRDLAAGNLNRWMGQRVETQILIKDILEYIPWTPKFNEVLENALNNRAELKILNNQIEIAKSVYSSEEGANLPKMFIFADYNYSSSDSMLSQNSLTGGIGVKYNVFDGRINRSLINRKKEQTEIAKDIFADGVADISIELKKTCADIFDALEKLKTAIEQKNLFYKNENITQRFFNEGLVSSTELLSARNKSLFGNAIYFQSLYQYHQAVAGYSLASGVAKENRS